jgi:hypothetical protein
MDATAPLKWPEKQGPGNSLPLISEEIRKKLRAPLPAEGIKQHENKPYLSTIKSIYIVERLNEVFGIGRWTVIHKVINTENEYVLMKGRLIILDYDCRLPWIFGGHKTEGKGTEPADGYKSAVTDIISKSASYLEIGIDVFKGKGGSGSQAPRRRAPQKKSTPGDQEGSQEDSRPENESQEPKITNAQVRELSEIFFGLEPDKRAEVLERAGISAISSTLTPDQAEEIKEDCINMLQGGV